MRRFIGMALMCVAAIVFLAPTTVQAQDQNAFKQALAELNMAISAKKQGEDLARAVNVVADAMFPDAEEMAIKTILKVLGAEVGKAKGGKNEQNVSGEVLDACATVFAKVESDKGLELLAKYVKKKNLGWRIRFYIVDGIKDKRSSIVIDLLKDLVADGKEDPRVRLAAIRAAETQDASTFMDSALEATKGPQWEIKEAALKAISKWGDSKAVDRLIDMLDELKEDEGRVKELLLETLEDLTGFSREEVGKYNTSGSWRGPWGKKQAGNDGDVFTGGDNGDGGGTMVEEDPPTTYYGIKTRSTRIIFIMDITGSMAEDATDSGNDDKDKPENDPNDIVETGSDPDMTKKDKVIAEMKRQGRQQLKEKKKEYDDRAVSTKIDSAKKKLINTIYYLNEKVHFTIIFYSGGSSAWKEIMVPATPQNKLEAIEAINQQNPAGPTNTFGALEMAFKLTEKGKPENKIVALDNKGNYAEMMAGADTIFLVTDGKPNTGRIPDPDPIRAEVKKINKLREVVIHTIGVGNDLDTAFLSGLASENGGTFVHVK